MAKVVCSKENCTFNEDQECTLPILILEVYPNKNQLATCNCSAEKAVSNEVEVLENSESKGVIIGA